MYNGDDAGRACTVWVFFREIQVFSQMYILTYFCMYMYISYSILHAHFQCLSCTIHFSSWSFFDSFFVVTF